MALQYFFFQKKKKDIHMFFTSHSQFQKPSFEVSTIPLSVCLFVSLFMSWRYNGVSPAVSKILSVKGIIFISAKRKKEQWCFEQHGLNLEHVSWSDGCDWSQDRQCDRWDWVSFEHAFGYFYVRVFFFFFIYVLEMQHCTL